MVYLLLGVSTRQYACDISKNVLNLDHFNSHVYCICWKETTTKQWEVTFLSILDYRLQFHI